MDPTRVQSHLCSMYGDDHLGFAFREIGVEPVFVGHRGMLSFTSSVLRVVRLIRERGIDLVHSNQVIDHAIAGTAARLCNVPVVTTLHWTAEHSTPETPSSVAERVRGRTIRAARHGVRIALDNLLADRIIAVSEAVTTSHAELLGSWFPVSKVDVVYPGLDFSEVVSMPAERTAAFRRELGVGDASSVLLNIGRLDPVKGQRHLIPMMAALRQTHPNVRLLIAGDGQLRESLAAEIERQHLADNIIMLGWRLDTSALLAASDVLVVPSDTEAAPLPLLEAARQGKPVVATRVGGVPEILVDGVNGYVVPRADPIAMAHAVARILDEPGGARRMGDEARRLASARFQLEDAARAVMCVYERAVQRSVR